MQVQLTNFSTRFDTEMSLVTTTITELKIGMAVTRQENKTTLGMLQALCEKFNIELPPPPQQAPPDTQTMETNGSS